MRTNTLVPVALFLLSGCGGELDTHLGEGGGMRQTESTHCAGTTVEGVDVSDAQGTIDWGAAHGAGIRFMYAKATQGTYNTQKTFAHNWSASKAAGVFRGAYHFFDPTEDGAAQAQHFLSVVGTMAADDLPPMLDLECPDGDSRCLGWSGGTGQAPASAIKQRVDAFLSAVESATGKRPVIYTFSSYFSSNGVSTSGMQGYPLYIAWPTTGGCFNVPPPWGEAKFWQYSWQGQVSGIPSAVDRDRFLGGESELAAFAGGSAPPPAPVGCYSATLAKDVEAGTCVQAASDGQWYHCDNGAWLDGQVGCTSAWAWCHSGTLGKDEPPRTCVQSKFDSVWYQCAMGWQPESNGQGPAGTCSAEYSL